MSHVTSERVMSIIKEGLEKSVDELVRCVDEHMDEARHK